MVRMLLHIEKMLLCLLLCCSLVVNKTNYYQDMHFLSIPLRKTIYSTYPAVTR